MPCSSSQVSEIVTLELPSNSSELQMYVYTPVVPADTQIKEENFLEDIGNLLNTGEVPNMFPIDEKNEICSKMRQIDKSVEQMPADTLCNTKTVAH